MVVLVKMLQPGFLPLPLLPWRHYGVRHWVHGVLRVLRLPRYWHLRWRELVRGRLKAHPSFVLLLRPQKLKPLASAS